MAIELEAQMYPYLTELVHERWIEGQGVVVNPIAYSPGGAIAWRRPARCPSPRSGDR